MTKTDKVNIYSTLSGGGVKVWALQLSNELSKLRIDNKVIDTLPGYFLQPFRTGVTHSTLPFSHPLRGKYILTLQGIFTEEHLIWSKLYPFAISQADTVTVPCRFLQEKLQLKKAMIIPNGIETPTWTKTDYHLKGDRPTLGILTGFSFLNKARGLIDLAEIVKTLDGKVKLLIGGNPGIYFDRIKAEVIKTGIDCEFLGFCDKEDFYQKIDIFTYFSHQDVFSIALLETMSRGIPVISNNVGGTKDMFDSKTNDLLVNNNKDYTEVLSSLISSEELREKYGQLQGMKCQEFYWENIIPKWIETYRN
ncbi:MAG: glycosyltransferase family 4 protein [Patescibacteria group bacterium]